MHSLLLGISFNSLTEMLLMLPHDKRGNSTNLPMVAGESAVMMNRVPTCSTGDLTTVTLTQGGQMSLPAKKKHFIVTGKWQLQCQEQMTGDAPAVLKLLPD